MIYKWSPVSALNCDRVSQKNAFQFVNIQTLLEAFPEAEKNEEEWANFTEKIKLKPF